MAFRSGESLELENTLQARVSPKETSTVFAQGCCSLLFSGFVGGMQILRDIQILRCVSVRIPKLGHENAADAS